ncbi:MAG TPA: hypothetical protein VE077_11600 [Candidatus Methylomirabilis sp.]|nr:hypothetical protein [Candidatus Methylomirabilis sp.]
MKDLRLEELLRYGFSGGSLLAVILLMHPDWWKDDPTRAKSLGGTAILLGTALLTGSLIYALHRAMAYRILFALAAVILTGCRVYRWETKILLPLVPSEIELKLDRWRLRIRQKKDPIDTYTSEWGAQVHLLYCTSWAILLGMGIAAIWPNSQSVISGAWLVVASAIIALSGLWHHVRLLWWIKANENEDFSKHPGAKHQRSAPLMAEPGNAPRTA